MAEPTANQILALQLDPERNGGRVRTVRDYLVSLLATLWREGSDFSAKRPLGMSDWQWQIYSVLVKAGLVAGTFDSLGDLDDVDHRAADTLIAAAILALDSSPTPPPTKRTYEYGFRSKITGHIEGASEPYARAEVAECPDELEVVRHLVGPWETVREASDG